MEFGFYIGSLLSILENKKPLTHASGSGDSGCLIIPHKACESEAHSADQRLALRLKLNTKVVFSHFKPFWEIDKLIIQAFKKLQINF